MLTVINLAEINGEPKVKLDLPPMRVGEPIALRFRLERTHGGRHEVLLVDHKFRVTALGVEARGDLPRQLLSVELIDSKGPVWTAVKKPRSRLKRLSPAVTGRTPV